jgi:2-oxoglutarate dehydrogenase E2 component (dihydrolipoamide succinyltransferase)
MAIEIKIPKVGESISEVQISEWLKSAGDQVRKDEPLAIIDSEKTTFELPATDSGTLTKILHQAGETVSVGSVIAQLEPGETPAPAPAPPPADASKQESKPAPARKGAPKNKRPADQSQTTTADGEKGQPNASPSPAPPETTASDASASAKLEPTRVAPADKGDRREPPEFQSPRIVSAAVPSTRQETSAEDEEEVVPMTMLRRTVARRLVEAKKNMAMLTTFNEVDMSSVQQLRHEFQDTFRERHGTKLGLMSFFVKAAIEALKQFPQLNAEVRGNDVIYRNYFDIGVALATERGLVVPVLRRAERLSFAGIEKAIGDFARRAKEADLQPRDLEGGTFTITNGGVFGSLLSTPIINPPQSGILGMHGIEDRPVARAGQVVIRPMMYLALTYDHRIVDGREAVLFLRRIREVVENPARMLIEI